MPQKLSEDDIAKNIQKNTEELREMYQQRQIKSAKIFAITVIVVMSIVCIAAITTLTVVSGPIGFAIGLGISLPAIYAGIYRPIKLIKELNKKKSSTSPQEEITSRSGDNVPSPTNQDYPTNEQSAKASTDLLSRTKAKPVTWVQRMFGFKTKSQDPRSNPTPNSSSKPGQ